MKSVHSKIRFVAIVIGILFLCSGCGTVRPLHPEPVRPPQIEPVRPPQLEPVRPPQPERPSSGPRLFVDGPLPGMKFAYIPPGTFMMGSPADELGRQSNEEQHRVTLTRGFYLMTTEVTQAQWEAVMGGNPSQFRNCGSDCPVDSVCWTDVQEFINRLNQRSLATRYRFRLPTEAEWEYAARAGSTSAFANGGIVEPECGHDPNLDAMGWYCGNSNGTTHPVGRKLANAWGLYDMHGNVWEWVQDWYGDYPSGAVTDPIGPASGADRVLRGGSCHNDAGHCRSADRGNLYPGFRFDNVGFRLAGQF